MSKQISITQAQKAEKAAFTAVNSLTDDTAFPALKTARDVASATTLAFVKADHLKQEAEKFAGGARGLAVVAVLAAWHTEEACKGYKRASDVLTFLCGDEVGMKFAERDNSNKQIKSQVGRVAQHVAETFAPAETHDAAAVIVQARKHVADMLGAAGSWAKLYDAAPKQAASGAKGKAKQAGEKAEPVTDDEAVMTCPEVQTMADKLRDVLAGLYDAGDTEALDVAKRISAQFAALAGIMEGEAKKAAKKAA